MPVDFRRWIHESQERINEWGSRGVLQSLYYCYVGGLLHASKRLPLGTNIHDKEWDLLIILDACRVDALRHVGEEYDFLDEIDSIWSVGSTSFEWMTFTFRQRHLDKIQQTAYITGNPYPTRVFTRDRNPPVRTAVPFGPRDYDSVDASDFCYLDEIVEYGVNEEFEAVLPRTVTDRAVSVGRQRDCKQVIAHYMQPHVPYLGEMSVDRPEFRRFMKGEVPREQMWEAYLDNLRYVLDEVAVLLENFDAANTVITADHGEAFGELGFYDHTIGCPLPVVRKVPWARTSAEDQTTYEPSVSPKETESFDREEHLEDLGYL